jgi:hypothetical protein
MFLIVLKMKFFLLILLNLYKKNKIKIFTFNFLIINKINVKTKKILKIIFLLKIIIKKKNKNQI